MKYQVDEKGFYGDFGGAYIPEMLYPNVEELRQNYKITLAGPNVLCSMIQAFHLGFQTLKIQKHAKQISSDGKQITNFANGWVLCIEAACVPVFRR